MRGGTRHGHLFTIPEPPPDGKWVTQVTFQEPGAYVLRAVASDGSLFTYVVSGTVVSGTVHSTPEFPERETP